MYRLFVITITATLMQQAADDRPMCGDDPSQELLQLSRHMSLGVPPIPLGQSSSLSRVSRRGSLSPQSPRAGTSGSLHITSWISPNAQVQEDPITLMDAIRLPHKTTSISPQYNREEKRASTLIKTPRFMELSSSPGTTTTHEVKKEKERKSQEKRVTSAIKSPRVLELLPENDGKQSSSPVSRIPRCSTMLSSSSSAMVIHPETKKTKSSSRSIIKSPQLVRARTVSPDTHEMLSEYGLWNKPYREMDLRKRTFLINAAIKNQLVKAAKLLAYDESGIDKQDKDGKTALIAASERGYGDMVNLILQHKSRAIYHKDKSGNTALMYGAKCGDMKTIKCIMLVDRSGINLRNKEGKTAQDIAIDYGAVDIVRELADEQQVGSEQSKKRTSLILASERGDSAMVGTLLKCQTEEVYPQDAFGYTPLMYSAMRNDREMADAILSADTSGINYRDREGKTALIHAAECGSLMVVQELLHYEPNTDLEDSNGFTAIQYASAESATLNDDDPAKTIYVKIIQLIKKYTHLHTHA